MYPPKQQEEIREKDGEQEVDLEYKEKPKREIVQRGKEKHSKCPKDLVGTSIKQLTSVIILILNKHMS